MNEAELRRLAELVNQLALKDSQPSFDYWALAGAFIGGILVNIFTEWLRSHLTHRAILRTARAELYRSLVDYRELLVQLIHAPLDDRIVKGLSLQLQASRQRIRADLIAVDDRRYARRVANIVLANSKLSHSARLTDLNRVIDKLEQHALPLFESVEQELKSRNRSY